MNLQESRPAGPAPTPEGESARGPRNTLQAPPGACALFELPARRRTQGPLTVTEVEGLAGLRALEPEWNALVADTDDQVFYRSELLQAWVRHFAPGAPLRVLTARDGTGRLEAALPLLRGHRFMPGLPARVLHAPSNLHTCRFDLVAREGVPAARALFAHLAADRSWDVIRLPNVPDGGAAWLLQRVAEEAGYPVGSWESHASPYTRLPRSLQALWQGWGKNLTSNLRRRRRRLSEQGHLSVECFRGGPELEQRLDECFALEASGWKGRAGSAMAQQPAVRSFFGDLARAAQTHGYLSLYFLRLDGRAIAVDFALRYGTRYLSFKAGYDERYAACSPGQLLTAESLQACVQAGLDEFDLLGPDFPWKREWAAEVRPHGWAFIFRDSRLGRALHRAKFHWAPALKRLLGRRR